MWGKPKKRRKRREKRDSLFLLLIFVLFNFDVALALQEVVYKDSRPPKKIAETQKEAGEQEATSEEKKELRYAYDPTGKPDPFKSFIAEQEEFEEKRRRKPKTYLETLDLSQLELTAIVISPKGKWAMVRDSKGLGHVIKKGTHIGTNFGVVSEIKEEEVIIREKYQDFKGQEKFKDVAKKLPEKD